jgi:hypothetical protein
MFGEVSANFAGRGVSRDQSDWPPLPLISVFLDLRRYFFIQVAQLSSRS